MKLCGVPGRLLESKVDSKGEAGIGTIAGKGGSGVRGYRKPGIGEPGIGEPGIRYPGIGEAGILGDGIGGYGFI